jgi:hypothetical protein
VVGIRFGHSIRIEYTNDPQLAWPVRSKPHTDGNCHEWTLDTDACPRPFEDSGKTAMMKNRNAIAGQQQPSK